MNACSQQIFFPLRVEVQDNDVSFFESLSLFSAMFSNPSLPTYGQEIVNPENAEAENYEALLNLAERLGEAKPRGLLKTGKIIGDFCPYGHNDQI